MSSPKMTVLIPILEVALNQFPAKADKCTISKCVAKSQAGRRGRRGHNEEGRERIPQSHRYTDESLLSCETSPFGERQDYGRKKAPLSPWTAPCSSTDSPVSALNTYNERESLGEWYLLWTIKHPNTSLFNFNLSDNWNKSLHSTTSICWFIYI